MPEWPILSTGVQGKVPVNVLSTFIAANAYGDLLPLHLSALLAVKTDFSTKYFVSAKQRGFYCLKELPAHQKAG